MSTKKDTGFDIVGFRPVGMALAILMDNEAKAQLNPEEHHKKKESVLHLAGDEKKLIYKGDKIEKEEAEKEAIFIVAAISQTLAEMIDAPSVGDRIIVRAATGFHPLVINGKEYGICPSHLVLAVVKAN